MFLRGLVLLAAIGEPGANDSSLMNGMLAVAAEADAVLGLKLPARQDTEQEIEDLVRRARQAVTGKTPAVKIAQLNHLIFDELGFRRQLDHSAMGPMLLPYVLQRREGTCLGLAGLFLTLAERLGVPLAGVLAPGHFFVRYDDGHTTRDIELLKQGRQMPRRWYRQHYGVPERHPLYLRSLDRSQTLAVFHYNLANMYRERGDHRKAIERYQQVLAVLPDFAEAHANLGLAYQVLGKRDQAEQAYRRAQASFPALPGLQHNLDALRQ